MRRRELLVSGMSVMTIGLAGCAGGSDVPEAGTDTDSLLPDPGGEWSRDEPTEMSAGLVGGEAGSRAEYASPDGDGYAVEVVEWPDESAASGSVDSTYNDWEAATSAGVFSFAATGSDADVAADLLAESSALDASDL